MTTEQQQKPAWNIKYWCNNKNESTVEKWLDSLTQEQLKSVAVEMKLLELCGNKLRLPHSSSLKKGLFELRERKFGYRIYYAFLPNKIILMLQAGDKKSQNRDIKIARQHLDELTHSKEE
jgi:putative addiction module killer protein